jgi:hydroxyacylglutathione hydrolase
VQELCRQLDAREPVWVLDVRSSRELARDGCIPGAHHIPITQVRDRLDELPGGRAVTIFGDGLRSMIAASLMRCAGASEPVVVLGGLSAWDARSCPIAR